MKIGDYILKEDILSEKHLEQIRDVLEKQGWLVEPEWGQWDHFQCRPGNSLTIAFNKRVLWASNESEELRGNRIHPADLLNEPAWIEHDGSVKCPVPEGHDAEVMFENGKQRRDNDPQGWAWGKRYTMACITHYRDWTAFHESQQQPKDRPHWGEAVHVDGVEYVVTGLPSNKSAVWLRGKSDEFHRATVDEVDEYKPRTIRIGDRDVPEPVREPLENREEYYCVDPITPRCPLNHIWRGATPDKVRLRSRMIHRTESAARQHAEALIEVSGGEV